MIKKDKSIDGQPIIINADHMDDFISGHSFTALNGKDDTIKLLPGTTSKVSLGEAFLIKNKRIKIKYDFDYKLNNFGHRCEDFIDLDPSQDNILFAGCSFTFGDGLPYMTNWSGLLLDKLNIPKSNYYAIGYAGGSIDYIVDNVLNYIELFGKPKTIFALFPDSFRKTLDLGGELAIAIPQYSNRPHQEFLWGEDYRNSAMSYQYERVNHLEKYCRDNGILLIWSTWSSADRDWVRSKNFPSYVHLTDEDLNSYMDKMTSHTAKYYDSARDGIHPGIGYNSSIANIFKEQYDNLQNKTLF